MSWECPMCGSTNGCPSGIGRPFPINQAASILCSEPIGGEVVGYIDEYGLRVLRDPSHENYSVYAEIHGTRAIEACNSEGRERKIGLVLATDYAALHAKLDAVTKERDALSSALNPQQWTSAMSRAWHLNIPDAQKAFEELTKAALTDQGRAGEGRGDG